MQSFIKLEKIIGVLPDINIAQTQLPAILFKLQKDAVKFIQLLQEKAAAPTPPAADQQQLHALRGEVTLLRGLLKEKDALLATVQEKPKHSTESEMDINVYEEELNQYRRQLDADRERLNQEIQQLRDRNKELDEATRELELEMARERAEMARERTRMERMRDDIRLDMERK